MKEKVNIKYGLASVSLACECSRRYPLDCEVEELVHNPGLNVESQVATVSW
jgi:hypothetical protein